MPFRITCSTCGTRFALSDDLYERKIKNRIVTIRCKSCSSDISVDGEALAASGATETLEAVNEPVLDSDAMPASAKVPDMTPTVPLQSATGGAGAETQTPTRPIETKSKTQDLWVVCCPDEEDRELTLPEIEAAIAKNEVNGDAIVWRDGMAEWLPIHQVPELRVLLKKPPLPKPPKGRTLLGIGAKPKPPAKLQVSDPDSEPVSVEPEPLSESSEMIARRKGGAVALSPGLLSVKRAEDAARPEPPPRPKLDSIPEPPPRPKLDSKPEPPARPRMDSRPDGVRLPKPPTPVRPVPKLLLEERAPDSAPDSSGTPNLRALASVGPKKPAAREDAEKQPSVDDFMWGGGSAGTELLGAPTIDVAGLSARPTAGADAEPAEAPPSSARKKGAKKSRRPKPDAESRADKAADSARAEAPPSKPQAESRTSLWLVIAAAVLLVGGFLLVRGKGSRSETPPEPLPPVVVQTPPPAVEPAATVTAPEPPPLASAQQEPTPASAQPREPAAEPKEPKPERGTAREEPAAVEPKPIGAEKPAATEKPEKAPEKPAASAAAGQPAEGAPSAAFDRAAANDQLKAAAGQASACRKEGDPSGAAIVVITFAPSGRVTSANVNGPPFAGTATGGCIASAMRRAKVPPFSGEHITVSKTVVIR